MKYTLYAFRTDDEGGEGICDYGTFTPSIGYQPWTGWRAKPSVHLLDFSTAEELADYWMKTSGCDYKYITKEQMVNMAQDMINDYESDKKCLEEARSLGMVYIDYFGNECIQDVYWQMQ